MSQAITAIQHPRETLDSVRQKIFFIVGCGRSGTSLLQSMLLSHGGITIPPETQFYGVCAARGSRFGDLSQDDNFKRASDWAWQLYQRRGINIDKAIYDSLAEDAPRSWSGIFLMMLTAYGIEQGTDRVGDKSIVHTAFVGEMMEGFPEARFIHIVRDPRAVALSGIKAGFCTNFIGASISSWRTSADVNAKFAQTLGPSRYLMLRYEELVTDPEPALRQLCEFLGIEMTPEMMEHHLRKDQGWLDREKSWMENTLKPVFTSSIDKWRNELSTGKVAMVEHALGDSMQTFGYELVGARTSLPGARVWLSRYLGKMDNLRIRLTRFVRIQGLAILTGNKAGVSKADSKPQTG